MYAGKAGALACPCAHKKMTTFRAARKYFATYFNSDNELFNTTITAR
jgi:hypothetical protein